MGKCSYQFRTSVASPVGTEEQPSAAISCTFSPQFPCRGLCSSHCLREPGRGVWANIPQPWSFPLVISICIATKSTEGGIWTHEQGSFLSLCLAVHRDTTWNAAIIRHTVTMQCLWVLWISCIINLDVKLIPQGLAVSSSMQVQNGRKKHPWNFQRCPGSPRSVVPRAEPDCLHPYHPSAAAPL